MGLSASVKELIDSSSRDFLQNHVARIGDYWGSSRWLQEENRYLGLHRRQLSDEFKKFGKPQTQYQLAEYIAASSMGHVIDGWTYLGRAVGAQLLGDGTTSAHLAYYAELRAAMSVLATEGVGVFDKVHVVIQDRRRCCLLRGDGTHDFAWFALDHWAASGRAEALVTRAIKPGGLDLADWLRVFGGGGRAISTNWIKTWGLDLGAFQGDRDVRNTVSYRPSTLYGSGDIPIAETIEAVLGLWSACEPLASWPFATLDRSLLLSALWEIHESTTGNRPDQDGPDYQERVDRMIRNLASTPPVWTDPGQYLRRTDRAAIPGILKDASQRLQVRDQRYSLSVIARAVLLLRLATASVAELFELPDHAKHSGSQFWWSEFGLKRGLWTLGSEPTRFEDLWADVSTALTDLGKWGAAYGSQKDACSHLWNGNSQAAHTVSLTERIGFLGMML